MGELTGYFLLQYQRKKEKLALYLMMCFAGFLGASFFYYLHIFVAPDPGFWFWKSGVTLRFIGLAIFVFISERKILHMRFPVFTAVSGACIVIILILPYDIAYYFGLTIYGAALALLIFFAFIYRQSAGKVKKYLGVGILGGLIWGTGIGITSDFMVNMWQYYLEVGLVLQMVGMVLLGLGFISIRSFDEFTWAPFVTTLFILYRSLVIFSYSFEKESNLKDGDLLGGGIASALLVAQSIVKSTEPPEAIDYKDLTYLVKMGKREYLGGKCMGVLLVKKDLMILRDKLDVFLRAFEEKFDQILSTWAGDMTPFEKQSASLLPIFQPGRKWRL
ncbi:MAG TPA: hypothetical protein VKK79_22060 [Candidatus Lokiarchaeia archaeon]|nr:hypothetical protein [Candidatus Lokiarchaeia archaeon]